MFLFLELCSLSFFLQTVFCELSTTAVNMAGEEGIMRDHDAMGEKVEMTHEEIVHLTELTPEEKIIEKKLRRRIDSIILPFVITVYLMNYIDR